MALLPTVVAARPLRAWEMVAVVHVPVVESKMSTTLLFGGGQHPTSPPAKSALVPSVVAAKLWRACESVAVLQVPWLLSYMLTMLLAAVSEMRPPAKRALPPTVVAARSSRPWERPGPILHVPARLS